MKTMRLSISLPEYIVDGVEQIAEEAETFRSSVIEIFLDYCLGKESIVDELFPPKEEGEGEETNQDEEEEH